MTEGKNDLLRRLFASVDWGLSLAVAAVFAEVLLEVLFRYLLNTPLSWGGEMSQTILVWITFVGAAATLYRGEHMNVDLFVQRISSPRARRALRLIGLVFVGAFLFVGVRAGWQVVLRTWPMRTTAMQIPAGILYLAFPAGCLLMIPVVLRDFFGVFRR